MLISELSALVPTVSDLDCFRNFELDMTESFYLRWNESGRVERVAAMQREKGQKESERQLWSIGPVAQERLAAINARERQEGLDRLAAQYQSNPSFELDVDYTDLAIGLAGACHNYGFEPTFLLDDDGEF